MRTARQPPLLPLPSSRGDSGDDDGETSSVAVVDVDVDVGDVETGDVGDVDVDDVEEEVEEEEEEVVCSEVVNRFLWASRCFCSIDVEIRY